MMRMLPRLFQFVRGTVSRLWVSKTVRAATVARDIEARAAGAEVIRRRRRLLERLSR
jgi:hypothetical protein